MGYVDKYIKNLKPSDLSLSLWGGDVVLYNLDLKLDVLEKVFVNFVTITLTITTYKYFTQNFVFCCHII